MTEIVLAGFTAYAEIGIGLVEVISDLMESDDVAADGSKRGNCDFRLPVALLFGLKK